MVGWALFAACGPTASPSEDPSAPYAGTSLRGPAPDFELVDQTGSPMRLTDLRGKVVGLTFLDSQCRDVCPLTTAELITAWLALDAAAREEVAFVGVNVNDQANDVSDVAAASQEWRMAEIPSWRFVTGTAQDLRAVWEAYPIEVQPAPEGDSINHTSGIFLIDTSGELRWYVSVPLGEPAWSGPRLAEILVHRIRELVAEAG